MDDFLAAVAIFGFLLLGIALVIAGGSVLVGQCRLWWWRRKSRARVRGFERRA